MNHFPFFLSEWQERNCQNWLFQYRIFVCFDIVTILYVDGPNDQIETSDTECLCLTACNRYSNVTFKDLVLVVTEVTKANGDPVPNLPDGTPSVFVKPSRLICFGDLPPCNANTPDQLSCLSRELVLISSGALEEKYLLKISYCYSVEFAFRGEDQFELQLYAS